GGGVVNSEIVVDKSDNVLLNLYYSNNIYTNDGDTISTGRMPILARYSNSGKLLGYFNVNYSSSPNVGYYFWYGTQNNFAVDNNGSIYHFSYAGGEFKLPDSSLFTPYGMEDAFLIKYGTRCSNPLSLDFPTFKYYGGLNFVKSAKAADSLIRLVPAVKQTQGAVWNKAPLQVRYGFEAVFSFRFSSGYNDFNDGSAPGADGIAFVIQAAGPTALGTDGGGIGYSGISNCLAVEFDSYNNDFEFGDTNGSHLAVFSNVEAPNSPDHKSGAFLGGTSNIPELKADSTVYYSKIVYNAATSKLTVWLETTPNFSQPRLELNKFDISKLLILIGCDKAYPGFTSSTGMSYQVADMLSWQFCPIEGSLTDVSNEWNFQNNDEIGIFPNPASDFVNISFSDAINGKVYIKILNSIGEMIKEVNLENSFDTNKITIDTKELSSGFYFCEIKRGISIETKQFVILR
ncbi:MAG: hypothetical protein QG635_1518, partial [Bacteroidota bacterium]|nr:hypothetical protein [Bacteroidota bacterium]